MSRPQQRYSILDLLPPWLLDEQGLAFMQSIGLCLDMLLEKSNQAQRARMPGLADDSLLPYQAADRLMVQGPGESNDAFVFRLQGAIEAWRRAGSRRAVLGQVHAYLQNVQPGLAATLPEALIVGGIPTGIPSWAIWDSLQLGDAVEAVPAHRFVGPSNFDWDGLTNKCRAWLVIFMHQLATGTAGTAGSVTAIGGSGVAGVTSGFATLTGITGVTADDVQRWVTISGAASAENNGTFAIDSVGAPGQCTVANPNAVAPDANNGSLVWAIGEYQFLRPAPVWGSQSFTWGSSWTWGLSCGPSLGGAAGAAHVTESLRAILRRWKSAHTWYPHIIVSFLGGDATAGNEYSPNSSPGAGNPDGTYAGPGMLDATTGLWVPARGYPASNTAYCAGTGRYIQATVETS